MGAEFGATTSVFPSDENTLAFLKAQGRQKDWIELKADDDAHYAAVIDLDLSGIEPMIAQPHSPDNVVPIREIAGRKVDQICIGSCTNSSYQAMKAVASILRSRTIPDQVNLLINPGSRQVYEMLSREGLLADMAAAGARILEMSCGPCIGMGGAPGTGQVSVRSYNRNFLGRSGTKDAFVYLASPISCAVMAVKGEVIDPRDVDLQIDLTKEPEQFAINDNLIIEPRTETKEFKIIKGPNIKEVPVKPPLPDIITAEVLLKLGNNVTTDDIMPAGSQVLLYRSNIPAISDFVFRNVDETFSKRAKEAKQKGGSIVVGGDNYGQGSSREHAALAPMYLGLQAVIAKSFARIHRANLINFGVLPLLFTSEDDYAKIEQGDRLMIGNLRSITEGDQHYQVQSLTKMHTFIVLSNLNERERSLILAGGLLPYTKTYR
jgi:aconitate hydratase